MPVLWVACLFTFFIGFSFAIVMKFVSAEIQKTDITAEKTVQNQNWLKDNTIVVSAEVLDSLGIKLVEAGLHAGHWTVFGNNNKGFSVFDASTGRTIYNFNSMPGDGVMVEIPDEIKGFIFNAKY